MFHAFIWLSEKKINTKLKKLLIQSTTFFKVSSYNQFILATFK